MTLIGESTPHGYPFDSHINMLSFSHYALARHMGTDRVVVTDYSENGASAKSAVKRYFKNVKQLPDIMVIYSGHNEISKYYSPNIVPPLSAIACICKFSALARAIFRRLYIQQVGTDRLYIGSLFSHPMPFYEAEYNLKRYILYIESLLYHCRRHSIHPVVIIPAGNMLYGPNASVYEGANSFKAEAEQIFRQAYHAKYFKNDVQKARILREKSTNHCSFANLFFELGEIYYR